MGMRDAIKMINNLKEQCLAASWGHHAHDEES